MGVVKRENQGVDVSTKGTKGHQKARKDTKKEIGTAKKQRTEGRAW
jgi:hypothetical protein